VERFFSSLGVAPPLPTGELGWLLSAIEHGTALETLLDPSSDAKGSSALASVIALFLALPGPP